MIKHGPPTHNPTNHPLPYSPQKLAASDTSASSPVVVPTPDSITSLDPDEDHILDSEDMEAPRVEANAGSGEQATESPTQQTEAKTVVVEPPPAPSEKPSKQKKAKASAKTQKSKKSRRKDDSSDTESEDGNESDDESTEEEKEVKRKKKKKVAKKLPKKKAKKAAVKAKSKKSKKADSSDESSDESESESESEDDKKKHKKKAKAKSKKKQKSKKQDSSSESEESSSDSSSSSDSDSDSDSDAEKKKKAKKKQKAKKAKAKAKSKAKAQKSKKKVESSSESSESASSSSSSSSSSSDSESESEAEKKRRKTKAKKKAKKSKKVASDSSTSDTSSDSDEASSQTTADLSTSDAITTRIAELQEALEKTKLDEHAKQVAALNAEVAATTEAAKADKKKKKSSQDFKRVDQVWDPKLRDYKFTATAEEQKDEFDSVFTVRRMFNWENKYVDTYVDVKSKLLRNDLQIILKECKTISLVEDTPNVDPKLLFLYYDEIKEYIKKTLKPQLKKVKRSKEKRRLEQQILQCKLLTKYIDEDFGDTRKTLKSMFKAGNITYDLIWALCKPNTIHYTTTYGNKDDPRCFKVDSWWYYEDFMGTKTILIDGRYFEYDGKNFGHGWHRVEIPFFKGVKKITSLGGYPLQYHSDPSGIRKKLLERGQKFVSLQGSNIRFQKGLAYMKIKRSVAKFNINGRIMVDPAIFRRINPNYPLEYVRHDEEDDDSDEDEDGCGCEGSDDEDRVKTRTVVWKDRKGKKHIIEVPVDDGQESNEKLDTEAVDEDKTSKHIFTEEELLISSPVVLGFAFSEKQWLEFSLTGINEITWNEDAYDTLVLPQHIKQNLKGLVSSHRFNAAKTIDDVIQGKGKGLNVVLHGPPGVGKTLTAESIAEYLRCPLYAVSAGELGTNSRALELDLNRIMDICHSWGAILLLDEADVFLEARQTHDIHRNALVSVFLRLTEYYQGIMFLTTNRVETFDEAFQSRIHMGIRYENLTAKARKLIWQHHVGKVEAMTEERQVRRFKEDDYDVLAQKVMNGRQIKNTVKTSQSIALSEKEVFSMDIVKRVLEVEEAFQDDFKGGAGYRDAMRHYT